MLQKENIYQMANQNVSEMFRLTRPEVLIYIKAPKNYLSLTTIRKQKKLITHGGLNKAFRAFYDQYTSVNQKLPIFKKTLTSCTSEGRGAYHWTCNSPLPLPPRTFLAIHACYE